MEPEVPTMAAVVTALTTGFTDVATQSLSAITGILPVALPVLGAIVVVGIGIRLFKRVTGR